MLLLDVLGLVGNTNLGTTALPDVTAEGCAIDLVHLDTAKTAFDVGVGLFDGVVLDRDATGIG